MTARRMLARVRNWVLRTDDLREARAALLRAGDDHALAVSQARLLLEVARRVAEPVEALPQGSRPAVLLDLYRDAVYWALAAGKAGEGKPPADLKAAWAETPAERLLDAGRDERTVDAVKETLVDFGGGASLDATEDQAARARAFAEGLVSGFDAPRRRVERLVAQRWSRTVLVVVAAVALFAGLRALALGPNLAADKPFRTSSSWSGCSSDPTCQGLLFHTDPQLDPWVEFDLGAPKSFHRIEVTNRGDCCYDRAVPLIAEVSADRVKWTEVARRDAEFSSWTAKFHPTTARYVRLKVLKNTPFHLQEVAIR